MVLKVNSNEHKNTLRHRRDIPGPVLESLGCILWTSEIFENFYAFLQPKRYALISPAKSDFPFFPKSKNTVQVVKIHKTFQKFPKCKVCILSFPKPIPECLYDVSMYFMLIWVYLQNHKLCHFEQKMAFWGFDDPSCLDHKNWSKGRVDIVRSVLES